MDVWRPLARAGGFWSLKGRQNLAPWEPEWSVAILLKDEEAEIFLEARGMF
jgi:hypothetical protein